MIETVLSFLGGPLLSFFGGTAFRMIWGEVSSYFTRKQSHQQEVEMLRMTEEQEAKRHSRQQELIKMQHDLKIGEIRVQGDVDSERLAAEAFREAQKNFKPTGIEWVDAWNGSIRPSAATVAIALWIGDLIKKSFVLSQWDQNLIGAVLGFYFADRTLKHRGK